MEPNTQVPNAASPTSADLPLSTPPIITSAPVLPNAQARPINILTFLGLIPFFAMIGFIYYHLRPQPMPEALVQTQATTTVEFITPIAGEALYTHTQYETTWTPLQLQSGQVAQLVLMTGTSTGYVIATENDFNANSGAYTISKTADFWNTIPSDTEAVLLLKIGHYEQQGPGVMGLVNDTQYVSSTFSIKKGATSPQTATTPNAGVVATTTNTKPTKSYSDSSSGVTLQYSTDFSLKSSASGFQLTRDVSKVVDPKDYIGSSSYLFAVAVGTTTPPLPGSNSVKGTFKGKVAYLGTITNPPSTDPSSSNPQIESYFKTIDISISSSKTISIAYGVMRLVNGTESHDAYQAKLKVEFENGKAMFQAMLDSVSF
ncbi:MAG: hypothetical protein ACAH17_01670 [Candidatus Paceibacterota bacterium]